jgi:hypothetical protein
MVPHPLQPGSEIRCPHCHVWHPVIERNEEGTEYTRAMMYWKCRGRDFYAGQVGSFSRHPTRQALMRQDTGAATG